MRGWIVLVKALGGAAALAQAFSQTALAVDGVIEINQVRALAGGVTPGDTAGFPVVLSERGSYRLTGGLMIPNASTDGIQVTADNVTIDLNGFSITGSVVCTGVNDGAPTNSCNPTGIGAGVRIGAGITPTRNVTIRNGTIRGAGGSGIQSQLAFYTHIEGVQAIGNGGSGIMVGNFGRVIDSQASRNFRNGIAAVEQSIIRGNVVTRNGNRGIDGGTLSLVENNVITGNKGAGIFVVSNVGGTAVRGNTVGWNQDAGIRCEVGCSVVGNTVRGNTGIGLMLRPQGISNDTSGYAGNVIHSSSQAVLGGIQIGPNACNGNTTCP